MSDKEETNPAFEEYWREHGVRLNPQILELTLKEIALKSWEAATKKKDEDN